MLSYADRLAEMRRTKIAHTLAKRAQNGYTDLDDFGTVPLPEGYYVEPWYNSENGSFYGFDGMSENFVRVMNAHEPYVDPMEMLCGRWRDMLVNYRGDIHYMPDWMKKNPKIRDGAVEQAVGRKALPVRRAETAAKKVQHHHRHRRRRALCVRLPDRAGAGVRRIFGEN